MAEFKAALDANFGYGIQGKKAEELTAQIATEIARQGIELTEKIVGEIYHQVTTCGSLDEATKARYSEIKQN